MSRWTKDMLARRRLRFGLIARLAKNAPHGPFVEVGVFRGKSARFLYSIAQYQQRVLFLFDTFEGHPYAFKRRREPTDGIGAHKPRDDDLEVLTRDCPEAVIVKGVFPFSARRMNGELQLVAFAHVDVDSYRSTLSTIEFLKPLMALGGIMLFDDYHKHLGSKQAVHECFPNEEVQYVPSRKRAFTVIGGGSSEFAREWGIR